MKNKSVELVAKDDLCCSCGACIVICPKQSISWKKNDGSYVSSVDGNTCINCGMCQNICPGIHMEYDYMDDPLDSLYGSYQEVINAWSKNAEIRHISASGGVVTTMIKELLDEDLYDVAFGLDSYDYREQLSTKAFTKADYNIDCTELNIPKSRYLSVSHENAFKYIKTNPEKKVIIVGTSCAIRAFRSFIFSCKLKKENYLFIGLFCDKVFNYNISNYFETTLCPGKRVTQFHFKNKENGGWPGNMKFFFEDGNTEFYDKAERGAVKDYFMPERCLYCVDKLNVTADISLGDNYTRQDSSPLGSNSVIVRTEQGKAAWDAIKAFLEYHTFDIEKLRWAQFLDGRLNNAYFASLKENVVLKKDGVKIQLNGGIELKDNPYDYEYAWKKCLKKIYAGKIYDTNPNELLRQIHIRKGSVKFRFQCLFEKVYYAIKRRIKRGVQ